MRQKRSSRRNDDWRVDLKLKEATFQVKNGIERRLQFIRGELHFNEETIPRHEAEAKANIAELQCIVGDKSLAPTWQKIDTLIQRAQPNHVKQIDAYAAILRVMVYKAPPLANKPKSDIKKQWAGVLKEIKLLRRAISEVEKIGNWADCRHCKASAKHGNNIRVETTAECV